MNTLKIGITVGLVLLAVSCGPSDNKSKGTFPDFGVIAQEVGPVLKGAAAAGTKQTVVRAALTYTAPADWPTAYSKLQDVLGSPDEDPKVVTKMYLLINELGDIITDLNSRYANEKGETANCDQVLDATKTPHAPWFSANAQQPFFTINDTGKYTCYNDYGEKKVAFGRVAITEPPAACEDPYTYFVLLGGSSTQTNTAEVTERGNSVTISTSMRGGYNGCTRELQIAYAHSSIYETGRSFTSRSELYGNRDTHQFGLRVLKFDAYGNGGAEYMTCEATGKSQAATGTENFILSHRTASSGSSTVTEKRFCLSVGTTAYSYTAVSIGCSADEATFSAITPLTTDQIPKEPFQINFGL